MTEVASLLSTTHRPTTVRKYEAGYPLDLEIVDDDQPTAVTKEENWVTKKKTEVTNTKQIETRVKRQVVLEDGKIVEDTGPMVTTNTTEDTETQEHHQTELRKLGDDEVDGHPALKGNVGAVAESKKNAVASSSSVDGLVREVNETRVLSREETEDVRETEDIQHLGDITDEDFLAAVKSGHPNLNKVLRTNESGRAIVSTGPRLVYESSKKKKTIDTEEKKDLSAVQEDGKIVTESQRTTTHEEIHDDELPEGAPDQNTYKESSKRFLKTRDQLDVDYLADGLNIGHEMRFQADDIEVDQRGDGLKEPDFETLSAKLRKRGTKPQRKFKGLDKSALDRTDALTGRPIDFDTEEETRKEETSKWLENHFGSDSKSSTNSTIDDEEHGTKSSFFNVTIKSHPSRSREFTEPVSYQNRYGSRVLSSPMEPERDNNQYGGYYKGISEWSERKEHLLRNTQSPVPPYQSSKSPTDRLKQKSPTPDYHDDVETFRPFRKSPVDRDEYTYSGHIQKLSGGSVEHTKSLQRKTREEKSHTKYISEDQYAYDRPQSSRGYRDDVQYRESSPYYPEEKPTRPQRKVATEKKQKTVIETRKVENGYQTSPTLEEPLEEPPPDYGVSSVSPISKEDRKLSQKTRFADDLPKTKSSNIIGQSIRKLVGKIRSASAERKAKQRAKRSSSPSYQQGHVIDNNIVSTSPENVNKPVQKYYLGEDPFSGSIYGRENKYDGVKPARVSRRTRDEEYRSPSTLTRLNKSTGRMQTDEEKKNSQTLPRYLSRHQPPTHLEKSTKSNSNINISIINNVSPTPTLTAEGPAKPARTYKTNLLRSKSFNIDNDAYVGMTQNGTNSSYLSKLNEPSGGLKSPGLISSLSKSQRDIHESTYSKFRDNKRANVTPTSGYRSMSREEDRRIHTNYSGDIYEPPTRLRDGHMSPPRIGSDYNQTFHTVTRNMDTLNPTITNTTKSFSKRTVPSKIGNSFETIESSEVKSVTKSLYEPKSKFIEPNRRYHSPTEGPVVIEVRNNYRK